MASKKFSLLAIAREAILFHERRHRYAKDFAKQIYRDEISTRSKAIADQLDMSVHEVSVPLALASEESTCELLARRCAGFWQDDLRDVLVLENRLFESINSGALNKFVDPSDARRIQLRSTTKADLYRALTEG